MHNDGCVEDCWEEEDEETSTLLTDDEGRDVIFWPEDDVMMRDRWDSGNNDRELFTVDEFSEISIF
jgi:hypothetical protein